jgi:hypothetical protein
MRAIEGGYLCMRLDPERAKLALSKVEHMWPRDVPIYLMCASLELWSPRLGGRARRDPGDEARSCAGGPGAETAHISGAHQATALGDKSRCAKAVQRAEAICAREHNRQVLRA